VVQARVLCTCLEKSSQDTTPDADVARPQQRGKEQKIRS
jgi:hypothetical protein